VSRRFRCPECKRDIPWSSATLHFQQKHPGVSMPNSKQPPIGEQWASQAEPVVGIKDVETSFTVTDVRCPKCSTALIWFTNYDKLVEKSGFFCRNKKCSVTVWLLHERGVLEPYNPPQRRRGRIR